MVTGFWLAVESLCSVHTPYRGVRAGDAGKGRRVLRPWMLLSLARLFFCVSVGASSSTYAWFVQGCTSALELVDK